MIACRGVWLLPLTVVLFLVPAPAVAAPAAAPPPAPLASTPQTPPTSLSTPDPERFVEDVWVRETSVLVSPPPTRMSYRPSRVDPLRSENWLVLEDGRPAEIVRVERAAGRDAEPWTVWVWQDPRLGAAPFGAAVNAALESAAPSLQRLGAGEVTGDLGKPPADDNGPPPALDRDSVIAALDRLLLDAADRPLPSAGLLILPALPLRLNATSWGALSTRNTQEVADPGERKLVRALIETADGLSALGWSVVVLCPRRDVAQLDAPVGERGAAADLTARGPFWSGQGYRMGPSYASRSEWLSLDNAVSTELLPWRRFAALTGGLLVRDGAELSAAAHQLGGRYRIWFRTAHLPDGQDGRLEVRWLHNGAMVVDRGARRRGIPESVAAARARYLARYGVDRLGPLVLEVEGREARSEGGGRTDLTARTTLPAAPTELDPPPPAFLRLSCAALLPRAKGADGEVAEAWAARRVDTRERLGGPFTVTVPCAGASAAGWVLVVEDLETGAWGAAAVP